MKITMSVSIGADLKKRLEEKALEQQRTVSSMLSIILSNYFKKD